MPQSRLGGCRWWTVCLDCALAIEKWWWPEGSCPSELAVTAGANRCEYVAASVSGWKYTCSAAAWREYVFVCILLVGRWNYSQREEAVYPSPYFLCLSVLQLLGVSVLQYSESRCQINSAPQGLTTDWRMLTCSREVSKCCFWIIVLLQASRCFSKLIFFCCICNSLPYTTGGTVRKTDIYLKAQHSLTECTNPTFMPEF